MRKSATGRLLHRHDSKRSGNSVRREAYSDLFVCEIFSRYRLRKSKDLKFGNDLYHISADSELNLDEVPLFGAKYHFHLEEVVDVPEYLIYFPLLEK